MQEFHFPNWVNKFTIAAILSVGAIGGYLATCLFAAIHPTTVNVGYEPEQPVPFSHRIHAGQLKMDCRYCHNTVEKAAHAAIPPTATCGNCHGADGVKRDASGKRVALSVVHPESEKLFPVRESLATQMPIEWVRVHNLPDFVYFNHSVHVNRGVSCVSCHDRIDQMEVVKRAKPLSMKWCLDCHRNPEESIRPSHLVTKLDWNPDGDELRQTFFDVLDVDRNGSLDLDEAKYGFILPGQNVKEEGLEVELAARFGRADSNGDQRLSADELRDSISDKAMDRRRLGAALKAQKGINPKTNCSTCHR